MVNDLIALRNNNVSLTTQIDNNSVNLMTTSCIIINKVQNYNEISVIAKSIRLSES